MFFSPLLSGNKGCACIIRDCNYSFLVANAVQKQLRGGQLNRKHMLMVASGSAKGHKVHFITAQSRFKDYQQTL